MKKILAYLLALMLAFSGVAAVAEEVQTASELTVGSTTALSGSFFTEMWGNNTSDIDVRELLHGYNLMEWRSADGTYEVNPDVVRGLTVKDDAEGNRTYKLILYSDLKYSDGTRITAKDYAFSALLAVAPEVAAIGGQTVDMDYILGMDAYKSGESAALAGVRVLSDTRLSITVKAEYLPYFYEAALLDCKPYPISVIAPGCEVADDGDGVYIRNAKDENGETPAEPVFTAELLAETILDPETGYLSHPGVVSGPYTLTAFDWETRTAEFAANEYFKGDAPVYDEITFRTVTNETMMDELAAGEVNLLHKCTAGEAIDAGVELVNAGEGAYSMTEYDRTGYSFFAFCCEQTAVSSQAVRQAIAWCLDKDAMVEAYVGDHGERVDGYYGLGQWMLQLVNGEFETTAKLSDEDKATLDALSLKNVTAYQLDLEKAEALLVNDGWTLNSEGAAFDPEADAVRCKEIDGELVALDLTLVYPEGNAIGAMLDELFIGNLAKVGVALKAEALPMPELLDVYYRNVDRECDMVYLATNFAAVFDPSSTFNPADAYQGVNNRTAIADEELYQLAVDLRKTEPGDVAEYCRKWVAFQEKYAEALPTIPVYSNRYCDFYTSDLEGYDIAANLTWSQALAG